MKAAIWCTATLVTCPVFVLGLLFECAHGWFEIGRDAGTDWLDDETAP
jgi:hypothetical protein